MKKIIIGIVIMCFSITAVGQRLPSRPISRPALPMEAYVMVDTNGVPVIIDGKLSVITPSLKYEKDISGDHGDSVNWQLVIISEMTLSK